MAKKSKDIQYYEAVGRRKEAVARVRLYLVGKDKTATINGVKVKQGEILVNKKPFSEVFSLPSQKIRCLTPLKITKSDDRFAVSILTRGGGTNGQIDALVLGLARAIEKANREEYRPILKKEGLLARDARIRERRKVGTGGKARRAKQSPKR